MSKFHYIERTSIILEEIDAHSPVLYRRKNGTWLNTPSTSKYNISEWIQKMSVELSNVTTYNTLEELIADHFEEFL